MASQDDSALRAHIQNILLDYALTHLTTDYVAYTHNATNEVHLHPSTTRIHLFNTLLQLLSNSLYPIPTTDPTSFSFEPSVTKTLCTIFRTTQPAQYEERWVVEKEIAKYLRQSSVVGGGKQPSERFWHEDLDGA